MPPWSRQLAEMAANCMEAVPGERDYPAGFSGGFRAGFAGHLPAALSGAADWAYLGRVLDMFALSDLVTRPSGHPVADQAARQIRGWVAAGVPGTPG